MEFSISCDTYSRLVNATVNAPDGFKCVFIEHKAGKSIAYATNRKIAAIEFIGETPNADDRIALTIDPALVAQAISEKAFGSVMNIVKNDLLQFASLKTTFGYAYPGNAMIATYSPVFLEWRKWFPSELPKSNKGSMTITGESVGRLGLTAPSGRFVFPKFYQAGVPVMVRDFNDPAWCGLFMGDDDDGDSKAVTIPEWIEL